MKRLNWLICAAFFCYFLFASSICQAEEGGNYFFEIPTGYVEVLAPAYRQLYHCLQERSFPESRLRSLFLPSSVVKSQSLEDIQGYAIILLEKRDDNLDRVDFVSLKEDLLVSLEVGGEALQSLLPEGICDFQGKLNLFSEYGRGRLLEEGSDSISWVYQSTMGNQKTNDLSLMFYQATRLIRGELLHVYFMGVGLDRELENMLQQARSFAEIAVLQTREEELGSDSVFFMRTSSAILLFLLLLCIFSAIPAMVFLLKGSRR